MKKVIKSIIGKKTAEDMVIQKKESMKFPLQTHLFNLTTKFLTGATYFRTDVNDWIIVFVKKPKK